MTRQQTIELYPDDEFLFLDPAYLDVVIIGVSLPSPGRATSVIVYDRNKVVKAFVDNDGMTLEESMEFFDVNTIGSWMGEQTPIFVEVEPYDAA